VSQDDPGASAPRPPLLRVVRGRPTDEDVAALVVVLAACAASAPASPRPRPRQGWSDRAALLRRPPHAGPGGWRASALSR
jgi:hypothetical protein